MLCWPVSMLCCQATQPTPGVRGELHPHQPGGSGGLHECGHRQHRALRACLPPGSAHRAAQHLPQGTPQVASWVPWGRSTVVGDVVVVVELVLCILLRNVYLKACLKWPHESHEVGQLLLVMLLLLLSWSCASCCATSTSRPASSGLMNSMRWVGCCWWCCCCWSLALCIVLRNIYLLLYLKGASIF